ncbi:MAG: HlyC/CorC family transporter [Pseudohongiellaceae bacterium]
MSDDPSSIDPRPRSWIDKIAQVFSDEPTDTGSLLELLRNAEQDKVLGADALAIIEGALQVSNMQVRDIMIPRAQVITVTATMPPLEIIELVSNASHSRFPVIGDNVDHVIGILLAKDLLPLALKQSQDKFDIKKIVRPATVVPEDTRLNVMLQAFRESRKHMAIVADQYGSMSGLITIEDVLEQIVGDIEDETDTDEGNYITHSDNGNYIVKAVTPIAEFNEHFDSTFSDEEFSTVGGMVLKAFGHIPETGETINIDAFLVTVLHADSRQIKLIKVAVT